MMQLPVEHVTWEILQYFCRVNVFTGRAREDDSLLCKVWDRTENVI